MFCSVAMELERKGLRTASYPFDWVISKSFEKVLLLVENNFEDFLTYDNLYQESNLAHYYNKKTDIHFFHDFNPSIPLKKQIVTVQEKYKRRIDRFYKDIQEPTLFVRYCSNEVDEEYVKKNGSKILRFLRSYNPKNQILYVMHSSKTIHSIQSTEYGLVQYVKHHDEDIERNWIDAVSGCKCFLRKVSSLSRVDILKNLIIHYKSRIKKRLSDGKHLGKIEKPYYIHDKQITDIVQYKNEKQEI